MINKPLFVFIACVGFIIPIAKAETDVSDDHIRKVVNELLLEKDNKIERLEARIQQLEKTLKSQQNSQAMIVKAPVDNAPVKENHETKVLNDKFVELDKQVDELKSSAEEHGLDISGFFDFSARTENKSESTFDLGVVEIDLEYAYDEHFAASSALVWDDDSAEIGVAVVDFHMFDDTIPARGRIFSGQGFHLQAGRFDLPFAIDYQYFAAPDRYTVSAPMTTERIQQGGYNGDGVRLYGSWEELNYAVYWTNSVYEDEGTSLGGRLGLSLGQNTYRLHRQNDPGIVEIGVSHLSDFDDEDKTRKSVYAADLSLNYSSLTLLSEVAWLKSREDLINANGVNFGHPDELAYHVTLIADLAGVFKHNSKAYIRYGRWDPDYAAIVDGEDTYSIENISRLTLGFSYTMNDYLQLKFEYSDSLGTETQEPNFEKQLGTAQLVVAF